MARLMSKHWDCTQKIKKCGNKKYEVLRIKIYSACFKPRQYSNEWETLEIFEHDTHEKDLKLSIVVFSHSLYNVQIEALLEPDLSISEQSQGLMNGNDVP